jgi:hypothetical protein
MKPALTPIWFFITAFLEGLISPGKTLQFIRLVSHSNWLRSLRFQYIVLQMPPTFRVGATEVEMCYHCPDATIRNGRLTPVCIADWIAPPGEHATEDSADLVLARAIYAHLEEEPILPVAREEPVMVLDQTLKA